MAGAARRGKWSAAVVVIALATLMSVWGLGSARAGTQTAPYDATCGTTCISKYASTDPTGLSMADTPTAQANAATGEVSLSTAAHATAPVPVGIQVPYAMDSVNTANSTAGAYVRWIGQYSGGGPVSATFTFTPADLTASTSGTTANAYVQAVIYWASYPCDPRSGMCYSDHHATQYPYLVRSYNGVQTATPPSSGTFTLTTDAAYSVPAPTGTEWLVVYAGLAGVSGVNGGPTTASAGGTATVTSIATP